MEALFSIAEGWKELECPRLGGWTDKRGAYNTVHIRKAPKAVKEGNADTPCDTDEP